VTTDAVAVGVLGAPDVVLVDPQGAITSPAARVVVDWFVSAGDRWLRPAMEPGVRQHRIGAAPATETRLSVPGGDVVQRVYATAGTPPLAIIELENASADAVAIAVLVRAEPGAIVRRLRSDGTTVWANDRPVLHASRPARHSATADDEAAVATLLAANAADPTGAFERRGRRLGVSGALVWPLPHTARLRVGVPLASTRIGVGLDELDRRPDADAAVRGWATQLDRGMGFDSDDAAFAELVDAARATLLVVAGADAPRPGVDEAIACEDWGFDREAAAVWDRLSMRARRAAGRRDDDRRDAWVRLRTHVVQADSTLSPYPARLLRALHDVLLIEQPDGAEIFPGFPPDWLGRNLAVHRAPTRLGPVSFALRWHGSRPALLWDAPATVTLRAPRLDPEFLGAGGAGDALLAEPSNDLLALGSPPHHDPPHHDGDDEPPDPGSFS
jgi:hypothetical protein